jgi:hypothetical protein
MAVPPFLAVLWISRIPDPNFSISEPGSRLKKAPDPGSRIPYPQQRIKVFLEQKFLLRNMIRDVYPDSGFQIRSFLSPGFRCKKTPGPGSRIPYPDPQHCFLLFFCRAII